jgi:hypothetical protein
VVRLPFAADCCPCVEKLRTVLPFSVIRDGVEWAHTRGVEAPLPSNSPHDQMVYWSVRTNTGEGLGGDSRREAGDEIVKIGQNLKERETLHRCRSTYYHL